jgi:hypothetical protein
MISLLNEVHYDYREFRFEGLKFKEDTSVYPWKTDEEAERIFDEIFENKHEMNRQRYVNLMRLQIREDIHVFTSKYIIFNYLSILVTLFSITFSFYGSLLLSLVFFSLGLLMQLTSLFYRKQANDAYQMGYEAVESASYVMFD